MSAPSLFVIFIIGFASIFHMEAAPLSFPYQRASLVDANLSGIWIEISIEQQQLCLRRGEEAIARYAISSALKGTGQEINSFQTPLGFHRIEKKIGAGRPFFTIFKSLKDTRRQWSLEISNPLEDYVLTRVLTLEGLEKGFNKGRDSLGVSVDSKDRRIYIHGTPDENLIGQPVSHGCIRMTNEEICLLFNSVEEGTPVWIHEGPLVEKQISF